MASFQIKESRYLLAWAKIASVSISQTSITNLPSVAVDSGSLRGRNVSELRLQTYPREPWTRDHSGAETCQNFDYKLTLGSCGLRITQGPKRVRTSITNLPSVAVDSGSLRGRNVSERNANCIQGVKNKKRRSKLKKCFSFAHKK